MQEAASRAVETEYVREIPYPRRFIPQLGPSQLRLVAAMNGIRFKPALDRGKPVESVAQLKLTDLPLAL